MENLKDLHKNLLSADEKRKVLKELDLFVLDNSMRETTIGQLRGHTLENKWEIYDEVRMYNIVINSNNRLQSYHGVFWV